MSVVTKTGDKGKTRLFSGEEIDKTSLRVETYGTLDELNSAIGLAKSLCGKSLIRTQLHDVQKRLFTLGMELATDPAKHAKLKDRIIAADITKIEKMIYDHEKELKLPPEFIIPGKTTAAGAIDVARTVARRLERAMLHLRAADTFANSDAFIWVNRLSDFLFIAARVEES